MAFPSTLLDIQDAVQSRLRLESPDANSLVTDWINQAYAQVCLETECLQTDATLTLTANTYSYTLPTGIIHIKQMTVKQSAQSGYNTPLTLVDLRTILNWRQSSGGLAVTNGTATHYALVGANQLEIWPTPSTADTLLLYYSYLPTALAATTDAPAIQEPFATKLLEYGALIEGADYQRDLAAVVQYRQVYEDWLRRFRSFLRRREGQQTKQFARTSSLYRPAHDPSVDVRY